MKVYTLDECPEELKKALEDTSHAPVDLDKVVGGTSASNCQNHASSQYITDYATGHGAVGADAVGAGQCLGVNVVLPGWCVILDTNSPAFGCAIQCNSM